MADLHGAATVDVDASNGATVDADNVDSDAEADGATDDADAVDSDAIVSCATADADAVGSVAADG